VDWKEVEMLFTRNIDGDEVLESDMGGNLRVGKVDLEIFDFDFVVAILL
jgi:hypothetical protein